MNSRFARITGFLAALFAPGFLLEGYAMADVKADATANATADASTDSAGEYMDDAAVTLKVKASFAQDKWVKGRAISVRTDNGVVDLTGSVTSKAESERATELAMKVKFVKAVHNNLTISTP